MSLVQQALGIRIPVGFEDNNELDGRTARRRLNGCFGETDVDFTVTTVLLHVCTDGSVSRVGELTSVRFSDLMNGIDYTRRCEREHGPVHFIIDAHNGDVTNTKLPNR